MTTFKEWQVYSQDVNRDVNQTVDNVNDFTLGIDRYNVKATSSKCKERFDAASIRCQRRKSRIRQQDFYDYAKQSNALHKLNTKTRHLYRQENGVKFTADVYTKDGRTLHFNRKVLYIKYVKNHNADIVKSAVNEYKTINYNVDYK